MSSKRDRLTQRADGLLSAAANRTAQTLTGKSEREVTRLPIEKIRRDGGTQPRAGLDQAAIAEYAEVIRDGGTLPAVEVVHDGTDYWLWDGYHRLAAAEQEGETEYDCFVTPGTRRDAVLKSAGANAEHGLRRTDADKRRAVEILLSDPEWSQWSDREIARQCKVSHPFVAKIRKEMTGNGFQSGKKNPEKRIGADGREYKIDNIQASNRLRAEAEDAFEAKRREIAGAILAVMADRPMTHREIEFAVNARLGRIVNASLFSGVIAEMTRDGRLRNAGGGRYALPDTGASDNRYQMQDSGPDQNTSGVEAPVAALPARSEPAPELALYTDTELAEAIGDMLKAGQKVIGGLLEIRDTGKPIPPWLPAKLNEIQGLLFGRRYDDEWWEPGLADLLDGLYGRIFEEKVK